MPPWIRWSRRRARLRYAEGGRRKTATQIPGNKLTNLMRSAPLYVGTRDSSMTSSFRRESRNLRIRQRINRTDPTRTQLLCKELRVETEVMDLECSGTQSRPGRFVSLVCLPIRLARAWGSRQIKIGPRVALFAVVPERSVMWFCLGGRLALVYSIPR